MISLETGMRTKELFNLNWGDIEGFKGNVGKPISELHDIYILAYGKGKEPQRIIPTDGVFGSLEYLWMAQSNLFNSTPKDFDPVFAGYSGERISSVRKSLNALLEEANLKTSPGGKLTFSAYCFRHTCATWQLQKDPPMDVYQLAINMRTSVKMIEDYYSDVTPSDYEKRFRGRE